MPHPTGPTTAARLPRAMRKDTSRKRPLGPWADPSSTSAGVFRDHLYVPLSCTGNASVETTSCISPPSAGGLAAASRAALPGCRASSSERRAMALEASAAACMPIGAMPRMRMTLLKRAMMVNTRAGDSAPPPLSAASVPKVASAAAGAAVSRIVLLAARYCAAPRRGTASAARAEASLAAKGGTQPLSLTARALVNTSFVSLTRTSVAAMATLLRWPTPRARNWVM